MAPSHSQESELLCFVSDWICQCPSERQHKLPQLLPLLKLSALPEEQLSQQQLQACNTPSAVNLAQQLYRAAQECHHVQPQHHPQHQQHWQAQAVQQQQVQGTKRQAGPPVADLSVAGRRLARSADGTAVASSSLGSVGGSAAESAASCQSSRPAGAGSSSSWWGEAEAGCGYENNLSTGNSGSSRDALLVCSNNAVMPASTSCTAGSSSSSMQSVCDVMSVYEPGQIGAVVAQAWPGRQRGHQPTSILMAGALTVCASHLQPAAVYSPCRFILLRSNHRLWRLSLHAPVVVYHMGA